MAEYWAHVADWPVNIKRRDPKVQAAREKLLAGYLSVLPDSEAEAAGVFFRIQPLFGMQTKPNPWRELGRKTAEDVKSRTKE